MGDKEIIVGRILRKKKRPESWVLNVKPPEEDQVSIPVHVARDHTFEFLQLEATIRVEAHRDENGTVYANNIQLLQCAPIPCVIPVVLQGIVDSVYPLSVIPSLASVEEAQSILDLPVGRKRRTATAEIIRVLQGRDAYKVPRRRLPFVKQHEWQILEELQRVGVTGESGWKLQTIVTKDYDTGEPGEERDYGEDMPLNIPDAPTPLPPPTRPLTREQYIVNKKIPQVRWMVRRVKELYKDREPPRHILDVGGGRGDLATALALAFPTTHLTVVDLNQPSLEAGREYAHSLGCGHQIDFVLADMVEFVQQQQQQQQQQDTNTSPLMFDLVVALHACGDLSDLAMAFAGRIGAAFVVCPCCYAKRHIPSFAPGWEAFCNEQTQSTLRRLTELNDKPEVSRLALQLIDSMRFQHIVQNTQYCCVSVEKYDITTSMRNHVLVATKPT